NYFNMSGGKTFSMPWENIQLQIRCDASNVFNHPSFGNPNTNLGGSNGVGTPYTNTAVINSTTEGGRNLQLGAHLTF
ncbi:MAG TPA: hypothetical protein VMV57_09605, partial [Terracidiphilus sp.]|nr:hypothetical protein [Terracidiphilus sp.]